MTTALKTFTLIAILGAALSVMYYFAVYLPRTHDEETADRHRQESLVRNQKCKEDGYKYYSEFYRGMNSDGILWDVAEYHFNEKLNTCLVAFRFVQTESNWSWSVQNNQVVDVYANRVLLYGYFRRDGDTETLLDAINSNIPNYTSERYFKEKEKLFAQ